MRRFRIVDVLAIAASLVFLLGMVSPTFRDPSELANRVVCSANLGRIMVAIKVYVMDYEGCYPTSAEPRDPIVIAWHYRDLGILYPGYVNSLDVFVCPSSGDWMPTRPQRYRCFDNGPLRYGEAVQVSYAYSYDGARLSKPWTETAPPTTRVLADRHASVNLVSTSNHGFQGRNVALADGSVKWIPGGGKLPTDPHHPNPKVRNECWWSERRDQLGRRKGGR